MGFSNEQNVVAKQLVIETIVAGVVKPAAV
jgi:hypothetical protein